MTVIISGPEPGVDIFVDEVKGSNFARDRSWRTAADLRTAELRTKPVTFNVLDERTKVRSYIRARIEPHRIFTTKPHRRSNRQNKTAPDQLVNKNFRT